MSDIDKENERENQVKVFTLEDFEAADTGEMTVFAFGQPTNWKWTFAGPGHPKTIAYNDRNAREQLKTEKAQLQARVNNKKYKPDEISVEERRATNIDWIVSRLVGWSPIQMSKDGPNFEFNEENARKVIADQRKIDVYSQAVEFLTEEKSFMKP